MEKFSRKIKFETIKALLARTGNQCAFPDCLHPIFNENNLLIAQLCHIEAVSPEGPRYNPNNTTENVNGYDNLMFLCYRHHKETDDFDRFNTDRLRTIKRDHEIKFNESSFKVEDSSVEQVLNEISQYWETIEVINRLENLDTSKIDIETNADTDKFIADIRKLIEGQVWISDILMKELKRDYFEIVCLALPNTIARILTLIEQLEIKIFELKLINNPSDNYLRTSLKELREKFKETARNAGVAD